MSAESMEAPTGPQVGERGKLRFTLSALLWTVAALAVVSFLVIRSTDGIDADLRNILGLILLGGAVVLLWLWFVALAPLPRVARGTVAAITLLIVGGLAARYRIAEVSGDMVPVIVDRWAPPADALLDLPAETETAAAQNVLGETTPWDFPQFLGPDRRAQLTGLNLATDWQAQPPRLLWKQPIGAGWSSFAVVGDYAVTQEQRGDQALVVCYAVATGEVVWSHADPGRFTSLMGGDGPRATPTVVEGKVYTLGADGRLNCLRGADGSVAWTRDVLAENNAQQVEWGRSASPLVVDEKVIVPVGAPDGHSLFAFHKETGDVLWHAGDDQVSYASPTLATLCGVPMVLIVNQNWLAAHRLSDGEVLFRHAWPGSSDSNASTSQPVALPDDQIFLSKGYNIGCQLLQVTQDAQGKFSTKIVWEQPTRMRTKLTNVVVHNGYVYGLSAGILECLRLEDGERMWKRGRFEHGQTLLVDDLLLVTSEAGEVVLVRATPDKYDELTRFQAIEGKTWNNPVLVGNRLLLRNHQEAACYELPRQPAESAPPADPGS